MVYNIEELAKRLANGESADTIAAEMADMLNAANAKVEEENRLAIAREKAERLAADKRADIREILTDLTQYLGFYYPDMCATAMQGIPEDEHDDLMDLVVDTVVEALDKTAEQMANPRKNILGLDPMTMMLVSDLFSKTPAPDKKPAAKVKSDDDILNDFLSKICH